MVEYSNHMELTKPCHHMLFAPSTAAARRYSRKVWRFFFLSRMARQKRQNSSAAPPCRVALTSSCSLANWFAGAEKNAWKSSTVPSSPPEGLQHHNH